MNQLNQSYKSVKDNQFIFINNHKIQASQASINMHLPIQLFYFLTHN